MKLNMDLSNIRRVINPHFYPLLSNTDKYLVLRGGGGSGKSHFIRQKLVLRILNDLAKPFSHRFICLRKTAPYARKTVFVPFLDLLKEWKLYYTQNDPRNVVDVNKTEMVITFPDGSEIWCMGLDDPEKIKSVSGISCIWMEEATDFPIDDFRQCSIRMRGEFPSYYQLILSFNPISDLSWVYKEFYDESNPYRRTEDTTLHFSTYKNNQFLKEQDRKELERYEQIDYNFYRVYTLGEWGSLTNIIFNKWELISEFPGDLKNVVCGLDFGYTQALALVQLGITDTHIYSKELIYGEKLGWDRVMKRMTELFLSPDKESKLNKSTPIYCDAQEVEKIADLKRLGLNAIPTAKGKGSVKEGIDLIRRHKLYVEDESINLQRELRKYKYKEDKDGNVSEEPVKVDDHAVDALRYAVYMNCRKRNELQVIFIDM